MMKLAYKERTKEYLLQDNHTSSFGYIPQLYIGDGTLHLHYLQLKNR
jgi:hypothetical protein